MRQRFFFLCKNILNIVQCIFKLGITYWNVICRFLIKMFAELSQLDKHKT